VHAEYHCDLPSTVGTAQRGGSVTDGTTVQAGPLATWAHALRVRQWIKNGLVIAVPLASGAIIEPEVMAATAVAFAAFCLGASSIYLLNDIHDREEDRAHPTKRSRPIASGQISARAGTTVAAVLAAAALAISLLASTALGGVVAAYLMLSYAYTLGLKHQPVLDIAVVAAGFVLRALAGGAAAGIVPSQWFLMAAAFGSLFLVSGKRYSEVLLAGDGVGLFRRSLKGYTRGYLRFVWTLAATVTVATYALWAFEMQAELAVPALAQLSIVPFVLAILRYAVEIEAGGAGAPEEVALRSPVLQALGVAWLVLFVLGVWYG